MKIKQKKKKKITIDILLDNETAYLTDITAIERVSVNKFVITDGHSVSYVVDSRHRNVHFHSKRRA